MSTLSLNHRRPRRAGAHPSAAFAMSAARPAIAAISSAGALVALGALVAFGMLQASAAIDLQLRC